MEVESLQRRKEENDLEEEHSIQNKQIYIENDKKYHQASSMMSLALLENEIKQVIGSTISSNEANQDVKQYLEAKRKELEGVHKKLLNMFSAGQLDSNKYLQIIEKMKVVNTGLLAQLQAENKKDDLLRVQQRLAILNNEYQSYQEKLKQEMNIEEEKTDQKAQKNNMTASTFFSKIDKLSSQGLAKILEKRIPQYWALANYLNEQIAPSVSGQEKKAIEERLQSYFYPLITQANQYQQELENGNKTVEAVRFIRKEMLDMHPELLHGKTLGERREDLKLLMDEIEECNKEETEYMDILKTAAEDPSQTLAVIKNKYKEAHSRIQKYQEYIELLSKLGSEKYAWVPTPKVLVSKEQRLVNLVNNEVSANAMQVIFKRLGNIVPGHYWIRWTIETQDGYKMFETDYCDPIVMSFDYNEMVEMTSKTKLDSTIEKKEINIEVLYKKLRILNECKYAQGSISLAEFAKTNTIEGKLKLQDAEGKENCELHYLLRVRHPITKTTRIEVKTIHSFQTFTAFNPNQQINPPKTVKQNEPLPPPQKPTTNMIVEPQPAAGIQQQQQQQPKAAGGLFAKLVYPPLVLLKQEKDTLGSLQAHEVPQGLTLEEILNPLEPDNIVSITVLKTLVPLLENSRGKLAEEGRRADNKFIGDMWTKALKKVMILEAKFGEGEVDPNEYLNQLKNSVAKDKRAKEFYEQRQDLARLAFIKEKLPIVEKEIQELEEALAQSEE